MEGIEKTVVCTGLMLLKDGVLGTRLQEVTADLEEDHLGEEHVFKKLKGTHVGGLYSVRFTDDGNSIIPASIRFTGNYADRGDEQKNLVVGWAARSYAVEVKKRHLLDEKRGAQWDPLISFLEPIRAEYRQADRLGRLAIELRVLDALRWGQR